jgi:type IV secretory pathway TrbL component
MTIVNIAFAFVASIVVLFSFNWVAVELVIAWYQVLLASSIGAASVGFFGSEATSEMAFRYTSGVVAGLWKVVLLTVWPYTVTAVFNHFTFVADLANPLTFLQTVIHVMVFSLIVIVTTFRIARIAEQMFSGQAGFTAGPVFGVARAAAGKTAKAARAVARVA